MKDKQGKHDHKLTKLLKFGLFATLMVAPLFAVLFKCMYVTFNKNAYQSYSGISSYNISYKYETNEVESYEDIVMGNIYTFEIPYEETSIKSVGTISYVQQYRNNQIVTSMELNTTITAYLYTNNNRFEWYLNLNNDGGTIHLDATIPTQMVFVTTNSNFETLIAINDITQCDEEYNVIDDISFATSETLDNAFYYSVNEMQNNSLFNWTTSTAIYTPIQAMTTGLGITTDAVAILLTYWLYLTLIYIVIDIVVELFTWMTHTLLGKPLG